MLQSITRSMSSVDDEVISTSSPTTRQQRCSYSSAPNRISDRWFDQGSLTTRKSPRPYTRKGSIRKLNLLSLERADYPMLSQEDFDFLQEDMKADEDGNDLEEEELQPTRKCGAAAHKQAPKPSRSTDSVCLPEETVPPPSGLLNASFSKIRRCLEDQQQRNRELIPPHVRMARERSNKSLMSSLPFGDDDDDETIESFFTPVSRKQVRDVEESPTTTSPVQHHRPVQQAERRPSRLDKSYLRKLAEQNRTSRCGGRTSSNASTDFGGSAASNKSMDADESRSSPRSTLAFPSKKDSSAALDDMPGLLLTSLNYANAPRMPSRKVSSSASELPSMRKESCPRMPSRKSSSVESKFSAMEVCPKKPCRKASLEHKLPSELPLIEICPGLSVPLRGSAATMDAVADSFVTTVTCFGCSEKLTCIADASYTICSNCRIVHSVEGNTFEGRAVASRWGLGLGLTDGQLFEMQIAIATARSSREL